MHNALLCPACRQAVEAQNDATISDEIIASGNVIFVVGINYAAYEEATRSVFSQMPSAFENHLGACFLRYKPGGSHNYDFTLVVVGENNEKTVPLLNELLARCKRFEIVCQITPEQLASQVASLETLKLELPRGAKVSAEAHAAVAPAEGYRLSLASALKVMSGD
jgi:hypothetical protein